MQANGFCRQSKPFFFPLTDLKNPEIVTLRNLTMDSAGAYRCTASNDVGEENCTIQVTMQCEITPFFPAFSSDGLLLLVAADGNPFPPPPAFPSPFIFSPSASTLVAAGLSLSGSYLDVTQCVTSL